MGSEAMTYGELKGLGHGTVRERLGKVWFSVLDAYVLHVVCLHYG